MELMASHQSAAGGGPTQLTTPQPQPALQCADEPTQPDTVVETPETVATVAAAASPVKSPKSEEKLPEARVVQQSPGQKQFCEPECPSLTEVAAAAIATQSPAKPAGEVAATAIAAPSPAKPAGAAGVPSFPVPTSWSPHGKQWNEPPKSTAPKPPKAPAPKASKAPGPPKAKAAKAPAAPPAPALEASPKGPQPQANAA